MWMMDRLSSSKSVSKAKLGKHGSEDEECPKISVVFQRDETGYGITVCGDNPVYIQSVKESGPAYNAGLRQYDRIIKVNGTLVTRCNHQEVVQLVKSAPCCAMTVIRVPVNNDHPGLRLMTDGIIPSPYINGISRADSLNHIDLNSLVSDSDQVRSQLYYRRSEESKPPTPPPVDRIPKHCDDSTLVGMMMPKSPASVSRRSSNPEVMHLGISKFSLQAGKVQDMTSGALGRSSSTVNMKKPDQIVDVIADEIPPPLPTKRGAQSEARMIRARTTSIQDVTDMTAPTTGSPPPPYLDGSALRTNGSRVPKSDSFSGISNSQPLRLLPPMGFSVEDPFFPSLPISPYGPFSSYSALLRHAPHLTVFLHYLFTNNPPSANALLFHLITDYYAKGSIKDMQRWVYEIHFTFLVPGSPLELPSCQQCIGAIDAALAKPDGEEALREIFSHTRKLSLEAINTGLSEFNRARTIGLTSQFPENFLNEALTSQEKAREVVDQTLGKDLEFIQGTGGVDDPENRCDTDAARGCALATFLKMNNYKVLGRDGSYLVDKWPLFVQKEKSRFKWKDKSKKPVNVSGHQFAPVSFAASRCCTHCNMVMWGVSPQGYQCQACSFVVHRACLRAVEETCIGDDQRKTERRSFIMDSFGLFGRKRSNNSPTAISHAKKAQEEKEELESAADQENIESSKGSYVHQVVNRFESGKMHDADGASAEDSDRAGKQVAVPMTTVGRSESLKTQKKHQAKAGVRKKSDPAHLHRCDTEGAGDEGFLANGVSASASSSVSLQTVVANESPTASTDAVAAALGLDDKDSDLEVDPDQIPNWQTAISDPSILEQLDSRARKRQEVLAELFHTEQTHVRNLKVLHRVFYVPLMKDRLLSPELFQQVFANLEEMIKMHSELNMQMRRLKKTGGLIGDVGELLLSRFYGDNGLSFKTAAAAFCSNQERGLEELKAKQKKDTKLAKFLEEAAGNGLCRRLQLKDIIPTGMQRLTKYPLLLENLLKYTAHESDKEKLEFERIRQALSSSKEILDHVNAAVSATANRARLRELQEKIDMAPFIKSHDKLSLLHKNLDLSQYRLLLDGDLTWRLSKQKSVDLHVILLDRLILLVTKQDDKLILKFHASPVLPNFNDKKTDESLKYWAPVLSLDKLYIKDVATDRCAFFLFTNITQTGGAQMYELVASTANEQKKWSSHISEAIKNYPKLYEPIQPVFPTSAAASVTPSASVPTALDSHDGHHFADEDSQGDVQHYEEVASVIPVESLDQNPTMLLDPADIVTTEQLVMDAQSVLTPEEEVRRCGMVVEAALADKQRLVAQIFGGSPKDLEALSDDELSVLPPRDLIHSIIMNTISLSRLVNESLSMPDSEEVLLVPSDSDPSRMDSLIQTRPSVPVVQSALLTALSINLDSQCTALMNAIMRSDDERTHLQAELDVVREQLRNHDSAFKSPPSLTSADSEASLMSEDADCQHEKGPMTEIESSLELLHATLDDGIIIPGLSFEKAELPPISPADEVQHL